MMPDSRVLIALAAALGVKIDYFFRPFTVEVNHVEFRKKPRFPERMASAVRRGYERNWSVIWRLNSFVAARPISPCRARQCVPPKRLLSMPWR